MRLNLRLSRVCLAALVMMLIACCVAEEPVSPPQSAPPEAAAAQHRPVLTDSNRYVFEQGPFGPELTITSRLTARPGRTLHVMNCNGAMSVGLQRLVGGAWVNAWIPAINGCHSAPVVIGAGESHVYRLTLRPRAGAVVHPNESHDGVIEPGTYRVVWFNVFTSYDPRQRPNGDELPLEERVSAPIAIEPSR